MGTTHTPIVGQFICGDGTRVGTWTATWETPKEILTPRPVQAGWTPDGLTAVLVGRPKLILQARATTLQTTTRPAFARPKLTLAAKAFEISPFTPVLLETPRLYLNGRPFQLGLSSQLAMQRPVLILLARELLRAGRPGLVPTTPVSKSLVPTTPQAETLTPTAPQSRLLVPTEEEIR